MRSNSDAREPCGRDDRWEGAALATLDAFGSGRLRKLRETFGSWTVAWQAGPTAWPVKQEVRERLLPRWRAAMADERPRRLRLACQRLAITVLTEGDAAYPERLRDLEQAAPPLLFVRGRIETLSQPLVTIVGTRRATPYGLAIAERIARDLAAAGVVTVSGLAFGIDGAVHRATLAAGGRTMAILASGPERASPRAQRALYEQVLATGVVLSEYPPGTRPERWRFPARNRILAGVSKVTIVVEAPVKSGALLTASAAERFSRAVYAVPGPLTAPTSRGCLELIEDGASVFLDSEQVLERVVGSARAASPKASTWMPANDPRLTGDERVVYSLLDVARAVPVDALIERSGLPAQRVGAILARLEVAGLCIRQGATVLRVGLGQPGARKPYADIPGRIGI